MRLFLLILVSLAVSTAGTTGHAQTRYRVTTDENFRQERGPQGRLLARVNQGTVVTGGSAQDGWVEVRLEGWIWERSVRRNNAAGFDLAVSSAGGENLRDGPNGQVLARLLPGFLLEELERQGGWIRVGRTGWMWSRSLASVAPAPVLATSPRTAAPEAGPVSVDHATVVGSARLLATPRGDTLGTLRVSTPARVLSRADGWARVRLEAWVREADLSPETAEVLVGVSGAEVRSGGSTYEGKVLRWTVQFIAVQTADELRRDMPAGQRYLLARGPLPEPGFVYILLSPERVRAVEDLSPLSYVTVLARVRTARSHYLGNPVLELVDFSVANR